MNLNFWNGLSKWSQDTFGLDKDRGPNGPLLHLKKEVDEVLENPTDIVEYADCIFLVYDAARRAGFSYGQLEQACFEKLRINKARTWPKPTSNQPVEHVREI
jgi:hypothetical protein